MEKLVGLKREDDRKATNAALQKLCDNPDNPGLNLEKLQAVRDRNLRSARVNRDVRLILHQSGGLLLVLYVDRHDAAYKWAQQVRVGKHPRTGGMQIVHTEETYSQEVLAYPLETPKNQQHLFSSVGEEELFALGVPEEVLHTVQRLTTEVELVDLCGLLPDDVEERLLKLYWGEPVGAPEPVESGKSPLDTSEARSQFFVVEDDAELERLLSAPWAEWMVFLHPRQQHAAYSSFRGPAKITGSAGTGKTVVALHRARYLAQSGEDVLLTTFSNTLASDVQGKSALLCGEAEAERIDVKTVHAAARDILRKAGIRVQAVTDKTVHELLETARAREAPGFSSQFVKTEWARVVVAQGIGSWEEYREAPRAGRGIPLKAGERKQLWTVFGEVRRTLEDSGRATYPDLCRAAKRVLENGYQSPYGAVVVDEIQDLNPQEILFLKELGGTGTNELTLVGDGGQRIYPGGFSLRSLGIETRGRSHSLHVNYRTSEQIRRCADRILGGHTDDLDEGSETRIGIRSLLSGPEPEIVSFEDYEAENRWLVSKVVELLDDGFEGGDIAIFARTNWRLYSVEHALTGESVASVRLKESGQHEDIGSVRLGTLHRAKGLEFRAVFMASVNEGVIPDTRAVGDPDDALEWREAYARERQLLYVGLTRARELAYICHHDSPSPFLVEAGLAEESGE